VILTETVRFGANQEFVGYLAWPERAALPLPGVVVFQEAFGVNDHIEEVTRRVAAAGYLALAPDLFAVDGVRVPALSRERMDAFLGFMNSVPPTAWMDEKAREAAIGALPADQAAALRETYGVLFGGFTQPERSLPAALAAAAYLRGDDPRSRGQKVAAIGFCMGGGIAGALAAHDPALAAAAVFYGMPPKAERVPDIRCPVLGFYGATDKRIMDAIPAFSEAMAKAGLRFEPHVYERVGHAFFNDGRPSYDVGAARDAWARLLAFLQQHLT
jgi:carboxymethylenebutenolidase